MARLNLADWIGCTEVEGPGKRFALWVQGCNLRCPGCCNPHMFEFIPRHLIESEEVVSWIKKEQDDHEIEGVTFLGGEPMLQARGFAEIALECKKLGLSIMVFTGYTIEQLRDSPMPGVLDLLGFTDLLVDGPYIAAQPDLRRNWVGSSNQRFHFITTRYPPGIEFDPAYAHGFEMRVCQDGTLRINGSPTGLA